MTRVTEEDAAPVPSPWQVLSVPLGGSALSLTLQADPAFAGWLAARPMDRDAWLTRVRQVRDTQAPADWLTPLLPAFSASGEAAARLQRAAERGVVVTTGQQPGLFGGPAYTWSKALSALAMADVLEETTGVPVAPVFWAATDDADWVEAATTWFAGAAGLRAVTLDGPASEGVAMADVALGPVDNALQVLREACGSNAHPEVLDAVTRAYVPHATVGASYVALLRTVLEPLGIAVLDAAHPALRQAADPLLRQSLRQASAIQDAVRGRVDAMRVAGFTPQVDVVEGLSLVFRSASPATGDRQARVRERVPIEDAGRMAREADVGTLGANVLLRPVLERALLPTIAYHAGPGEYAYFAQVAPIAEVLGCAVPLAVPRWSGEVTERRMQQRRDALGLDDVLLRDQAAAARAVARQAVAPSLQDAVDRLRVAMQTQIRAIAAAGGGDDAVVSDAVIRGFTQQMEWRIDRFERRMLAAVKRRETTLMQDVAAVCAALRPAGVSPERRLNLLPMLARFGPAVLTAMRAEAAQHAARLVDAS